MVGTKNVALGTIVDKRQLGGGGLDIRYVGDFAFTIK